MEDWKIKVFSICDTGSCMLESMLFINLSECDRSRSNGNPAKTGGNHRKRLFQQRNESKRKINALCLL